MSRSLLHSPLLLALVALLCVFLFTLPSCVSGSHFAYGTLSWEFSPTPSSPRRYIINFESAWRRDYVTFSPRNPSAGQTFTAYDLGTITLKQQGGTGQCCGLPSWDWCWYIYGSNACDQWSASKGNSDLPVLVKVTYPDNWLSGQTPTLVFNIPDRSKMYDIEFFMCCRVGSLVYSSGTQARLPAVMAPMHQYSPRSTSFPRQYIIINEAMQWAVPSIHPLGWKMTYSLTPASESYITYDRPTGYGSKFVLDSNTGKATWTPNKLGLYAISFTIAAKNPDKTSDGTSQTVLDIIFEVIKQCTATTPNCARPPVFDPAVPAEATFYKGSAGTFTVTARSDDNHEVEILNSPLPDGASMNVVNSISGTHNGNPATWTTYQVQWAPKLSAVPATVCFTARDASSGMSSSGSNCVNFVFGTGSILYVSGIMRDFHRHVVSGGTYLKDFNQMDGDLGITFVKSKLGADGKPEFDTTSGAITTDVNDFKHWFNTDDTGMINMPQVYDIVLNNATTGFKNVFAWNPGTNWWPLDNQLFGNEGQDHNRFFTLEVHSYITYTGGEILNFESSDDLFVFIDNQLPSNWDMGGIISSQLRTYSIQMDQIKSRTLDKDKTFPIDIFYAHRSALGPPRLKISMMSATLCNAIESGLQLYDTNDFLNGHVKTIGAASFDSTNKLKLISNLPSVASAAWFTDGGSTDATAFKIAHGFQATFSFRWDGITEGFAFVLQNAHGSAQGGQGAQLGYGGLAGIENSLAVEFDGVTTTNLGDPAWPHVSIHSRWTQANDANELYRISGSLYSNKDMGFEWENGTDPAQYTNTLVKVQYTPAVDNGQGGPQYGWVRVYMGIEKEGEDPWYHVAPIVSAQVDGAVLDQMWHGTAYVGFTASTSDTNRANIYIEDFQLMTVPPSADMSLASIRPTTIAAGQTGSMTVQMKDTCGNIISTGGDCAQFKAFVQRKDGSLLTDLTCGNGITDNEDGTYTFSYTPTVTTTSTNLYYVHISFEEQGTQVPISGTPFPFAVLPGQTDPLKSKFQVSFDKTNGAAKPFAGTPGEGGTGTITITAKDKYGNLQTQNTDPFVVSFTPDLQAGGGVLNAPEKTGTSTYTSTFSSPQATTFTMNVMLYDTHLPDSPRTVEFVAGLADASQSTAAGNGLTQGVASDGTSASGTFTVTLRDSAGNAITSRNPDDVTCLELSDGCKLIPTSTPPTGYDLGITSGRPQPVDVPIDCDWDGSSLTCKYSTKVAYIYTVDLKINGRSMPLGDITVSVGPAAVDATMCVAQLPTDASAGSSQDITIQLRDTFSNNVRQPVGETFSVAYNPTVTDKVAPMYTSSGVYTASFVPTQAGTDVYDITVTLGPTSISGMPKKLSVAAGAPDKRSSATTVSKTVASSTKSNLFTITSRDSNGNLRTQGGPGSDYLVTLTDQSDGRVLDDVATVEDATSEIYTVNWGTIYAGTYTMEIKVRTQADPLTSGGSQTVIVEPAATDTASCVVSGRGIQGGVRSPAENLTVTVSARDVFGNVRLSSQPVDQFRIRVDGSAGETTKSLTYDSSALVYHASYLVPAPDSELHYVVYVEREDSGSWNQLPLSPFTCVAADNLGDFYVKLDAASTTATVGKETSFVITETGSSGAPLPEAETTPYLTVSIQSVETSASGSNPLITIPHVAVEQDATNKALFHVTYTPRFTLPAGGKFQIHVSRLGRESKAGVLDSGVTASPFNVTIGAGDVFSSNAVITGLPATINAGATGTFDVTLRDQYFNIIKQQGEALTAEFSPLTASTGSTPAPTTGVLDTNTGVYKFTYTNTTAATYAVAIKYGSSISIGSSSVIAQITVKPTDPVAGKSLIQPNAAQPLVGNLFNALVAGQKDTFTLILKDKWGNPIALPSAAAQPFFTKVTLNDGATSPAVFTNLTYTGNNGAYDVDITATKANANPTDTWDLTVEINNQLVPITAKVHVISAGIDSSKSSITIPDSIAGEAISVQFHAHDSYDNAWAGTVTGVARDPSGAGKVVSVSGTSSPFTINMRGQDISVASSDPWTLELRANGALVFSTAPSWHVNPGPVDAALTQLPAYIPSIGAGETVMIPMGLRDKYNNKINNAAAVAPTVRANFIMDTGEIECGEHTDDVASAPADAFLNFTTVAYGEQQVNVTFVAQTIGQYKINITINDTAVDCVRLGRLSLTVTPGAPVASMSRVEGLKDVIANEKVELRITLLDEFGNQVNHGGYDVRVGENFQDATPFDPAITHDSSKWLKNTSAVTDHQNGAYTVIVQPNVAGTMQAVVTLNGWLIPTYNSTLGRTRPLVQVTPNVPASWAIASISDLVRAAEPFNITLQVTDAFGNDIQEQSARYNYTYSIYGQTNANTDYKFGGQLSFINGKYEWLATSAFAGNVTLSIKLQVGWHPQCSSISLKKPYLCTDLQCRDACPPPPDQKDSVQITVLPATCAAVYGKERPYRCPPADGSVCMSAYDQCPSLMGKLCPAATPVRCGSDPNVCVASADECPCPTGLKKCPSGACVASLTTDCHPVQPCTPPLVPCLRNVNATGQCRASTADCPAPVVCTPGFVACSDGHSCAREYSQCPSYISPAQCPPGTFRCPSGSCTPRIEDCPTPMSCPTGQVVCLADGSCAESADKCPDQYQCYAPTPFRCADGSCRKAADGCPAKVTCPSGWVRCENGQCAASTSDCLNPIPCDLSMVRCGNGACVRNKLFCPSEATCPTSGNVTEPVLCPDGSCAKSSAYCVNPRVCQRGTVVCPDGACATSKDQCRTTITCPPATPTLCADGVTCVADASTCTAPIRCPNLTPMRCPDGSCRGSLDDCPSGSACPAELSVRCADGSCVLSSQQCVEVPPCSGDKPIRCPGGECVASRALCPTHVTCPFNSTMCFDGSCRKDCSEAKSYPCASGQVKCPSASAGVLCVNTIDQCPSSFICPPSAPVRCLDTSCAASIRLCPPLPEPPEPSKKPCPDGSWSTDLGQCNTPTSCPAAMPFKCWDETCRAAPSDCTTPTACTDPTKPYRCPTGGCSVSPYASDCHVTIQAVHCPADKPVKCPSTYNCVKDVSECSVAEDASATPDPEDSTTWGSACPPQWARCRDGSCRMTLALCPSVNTTCPANVPFLCANGVCATNRAGCPNPKTGCFPPQQACPSTGECVDDVYDKSVCPEDSGTSCITKCPDGLLCVPASQALNYNAFCAGRDKPCALRCADGRCGLWGTFEEVTATTPGNLCTQKGTSDPINQPLYNICPPYLPYRCPNGLCAVSELNCTYPRDPLLSCPPEKPVQCATSICVVDSTQCPPLFPCGTNEMRCGDGTCREKRPEGCGAWGIANTCPFIDDKREQRRYRCANGLCAQGTTASSCIDLATGCPAGLRIKCLNGACLDDTLFPRYIGLNGEVDRCQQLQQVQADGCPAGKSKCPYDGECVSDVVTQCRLPNGCMPETPLRCVTPPNNSSQCISDTSLCTQPPANCNFTCADGTCAPDDDAKKCKALNGCPIDRPFRCADGSCAAYGTSALMHNATLSQVCPPTVTCAEGEVLCYDGSCAATSTLCPASVACEALASKVRCLDFTCVDDASQCKTGTRDTLNTSTITGAIALTACPPSVPIMCDTGLCVSDISACPVFVSPGTSSGTGISGLISKRNTDSASALSSATDPSSDRGTCVGSTPVQCVDGSCASKLFDCQVRVAQMLGRSTSMPSCPAGEVMCPNGLCVLDPTNTQAGLSACAIVQACPWGKRRCWNGACVALTQSCPPEPTCPQITLPTWQPTPSRRCEDGRCGYGCPKFNGCPLSAPFLCPSGDCAQKGETCADASMGNGYNFDMVKSSLLPPLVPAASRRRLLQMSSTGEAGGDTQDPSAGPLSCDDGGPLASCRLTAPFHLPISPDTAGRDYDVAYRNGVSVARLTLQTGTVRIKNESAECNGTNVVSFTFQPISDDIVRNAENRVPSSRSEVSASGFLTYAQTVLSPILSFTTDSCMVLPFFDDPVSGQSLNATFHAQVDMDVARPISNSDICLAKLFQVPEIKFTAWRCVYCYDRDASDISGDPTKAQIHTYINGVDVGTRVRCPVQGTQPYLSAPLGEPGVYAFIYAPAAEPVEETPLSWVREHALYLFLILAGGIIFIFFVFYFAQRLYRYRGKYKAEQAAVQRELEEVQDMEQFGGQAGQKDDEVVMMANPLVTQMKDMQARLDENQLKIREEEAKLKQEASAARREHIMELQADRESLAAELQKLKEQIELQTQAQPSRPQALQMSPMPMPMPASPSRTAMMSPPMAMPSPSLASQQPSSSSSALDVGQVQIQTRTEFAAQRPRKKGKDM